MTARTLMVQGTASSVGKSLVVAALCRYFHQKGLRVAPFKSQNMSNNAFVTIEGLEIGRAQAVQAQACGIAPTVEMNPILLKCESDHRLQLIVMGKAVASLQGDAYYDYSPQLKPVIDQALSRLREKYDLLILEGAGSPAEVNLQSRDLANMFVAQEAQAPVLLVGDIDRGGVFASLIGTLELLQEEDRGRVKGLIINKFRGNREILQPGLDFIERRTGLPVLGVLPYLPGLAIAEEDFAALEDKRERSLRAPLRIVVIKFPRISNFDEFQLLERDPAVCLEYIERPEQIREADLLILPGTKSTVDDLKWLRAQGFEVALEERIQKNLPVLGICGGYQMLGQTIEDPFQAESPEKGVPGLGYLPVKTCFEKEKVTAQVEVSVINEGPLFSGAKDKRYKTYEIHRGRVRVPDGAQAFFQVQSRNTQTMAEREGVVKGAVGGTLQHGLFENDGMRQALISALGRRKGLSLSAQLRAPDKEYDRLADMIRKELNTQFLDQLVSIPNPSRVR